MSIGITASGNLDNKKSWGGVKKHMEHDSNLTHKNTFLNSAESQKMRQYNKHEIFIDIDEFCEKSFTPYIKEHDKLDRHKENKIKTVEKLFEKRITPKKGKGAQPVQLYVEKLGDKDTYEKFIAGLTQTISIKTGLDEEKSREQAYKTISAGFIVYAEGFNKRNSNLKMFEYYLHMDEAGSPHIHAPVMPFTAMGKTKSGHLKAPSTSLNRALKEQLGTSTYKTNAERLAGFRKQEDTALIDSMNKAVDLIINKNLKTDIRFNLIRKTDSKQVKTGLDHDEYIAKKQAEKSLDEAIKAKKQQNITLDKEIAQKKELVAKNEKNLSLQSAKYTATAEKTVKNQEKIESQEEKIKDNRKKIEFQESTFSDYQKRLQEIRGIYRKEKEKVEQLRQKARKMKNSILENVNHFYSLYGGFYAKYTGMKFDGSNLDKKQDFYEKTKDTNLGKTLSQTALSTVLKGFEKTAKFAKDISEIDLNDEQETKQKQEIKQKSKDDELEL